MSIFSCIRRRALQAALATLLALAGAGAAEAGIAYNLDDVLYVAYVPGGREFIVDLGPKSQFLSATGPIAIGSFSAADLSGILGSPLPSPIYVGLFGIEDSATFTAYLATNGPMSTGAIGNAFGADNQIFGFGSLLTLTRPVPGNLNAGWYLNTDNFSYQRRLDGSRKGSLGGNVPFDVETLLGSSSQQIPLYFGLKDPSFGSTVPPQAGLVGFLTLAADGTLSFQPVRKFQVSAVFNPGTLNLRSQGNAVSFDVTVTDVTDPGNPVPADPSEVGPLHISSVGTITLPTPSTAPNCLPSQDGIWESHRLILSPTVFEAVFDTPSDGNCQTLDGGRQDVDALLMSTLDGTTVPICFKATIDPGTIGAQTIGACGSTRVTNRLTR